jgi:hypothetical protein
MALERIRDYCSLTRTAAPAKAWLLWARLAPRNNQKAILERALHKIPMGHSDYVVILLQLFGEQITSNADETKLFELLQRILLLAPKTTGAIVVEGTGLDFEIATVFDAHLAYLNHAYEKSGIKGARKVYSTVLFQSSVTLTEHALDGITKFLDVCLKLEEGENTVDKKRLRRLYERAIQIFSGTAIEKIYRGKRNNNAVFG